MPKGNMNKMLGNLQLDEQRVHSQNPNEDLSIEELKYNFELHHFIIPEITELRKNKNVRISFPTDGTITFSGKNEVVQAARNNIQNLLNSLITVTLLLDPAFNKHYKLKKICDK